MLIKSSTVETHAFTTVRRLGYHHAEVEAVMARLADTLRQYETLTADMERRLAESDTDQARAECLSRLEWANTEAQRLEGMARIRADGLMADASHHASATASAVRKESEQVMAAAASATAQAHDEATRRAEQVIAAAEAERMRLIAGAEEETRAVVNEATTRTGAMMEDARRREKAFERRLGQLRAAVTDIEQHLNRLAASTAQQFKMVGDVIDLEQRDGDDGEQDADGVVVDLTDRAADAVAAIARLAARRRLRAHGQDPTQRGR